MVFIEYDIVKILEFTLSSLMVFFDCGHAIWTFIQSKQILLISVEKLVHLVFKTANVLFQHCVALLSDTSIRGMTTPLKFLFDQGWGLTQPEKFSPHQVVEQINTDWRTITDPSRFKPVVVRPNATVIVDFLACFCVSGCSIERITTLITHQEALQ